MISLSSPAMLALAAAVLVTPMLSVKADTTQQVLDDVLVEEVFVLGKRRAYQGNFANLEKPSSDQLIDEGLLRQSGALSLDDALDLSASVARQNNFGGLWNSFAVRGFVGDEKYQWW